MKIIVKYLDQIKEVDVPLDSRVQHIKDILCGSFKTNPKNAHFIYNNYLLPSDKKIGDYIHSPYSMIHLTPKANGGNAMAVMAAAPALASLWSDGDVKKTEKLTDIKRRIASQTENTISDVCNIKQSGQNIAVIENIKNCKIGGITQSNELKNTCILNQVIDILKKQEGTTKLVDDLKNQSVNSDQFKESNNTTDIKNKFDNQVNNETYNDIKGKCAAAQIGNLNTINIKNCDSSTVDTIVQTNVAFNKCVREGVINHAETQISKSDVKQIMDNTTAGGKGSEKAAGGLAQKDAVNAEASYGALTSGGIMTDPSLGGQGIDPAIMESIRNDPTIPRGGGGPDYKTIGGIVLVCCCCMIFMMMMMKKKNPSMASSVSSLPSATSTTVGR